MFTLLFRAQQHSHAVSMVWLDIHLQQKGYTVLQAYHVSMLIDGAIHT